MEGQQDRRLAAVMFCDMVGFTAAMQQDEQSALEQRDRYRSVIEDLHGEFGGEIVQYYGDGTLSIFGNTVDAVRCGVAIQQTLSEEPVVPVRVGVHVGDVVVEEHGLLGDAVNVASRIESFGQPGAVLVSDSVHDLVKNQPDLTLASLGEFHLDSVTRPHEMFAVDVEGLVVPDVASLTGKGRRATETAGLSNLPVQVTSFVGRVQESAELEKLIRGSRLVTVTGAGGCGKSRLVVEVAAELLDEYPDGVWLVELAPLSDGRLVASTVANVLGVREQPGTDTLEVLASYLGQKNLLLVVDNCEHLIEPVADVVAHLLAHTSNLRVVATSREPLHVRGEAIYHLPTLPVPDPDDDWETSTHTDSVRLFAERAEAAHPGFRVTHDNGNAVASICRHLDGIPLAVELAASTTRMFTPEQIDQRLGDRFQLLTGGARDDAAHHQTLEATIDWSHELLSPEQRALFARLAVFAGSFSVEAAEAVCVGNSIPPEALFGHVVQLADRSLLETEQVRSGLRYRMLESTRAYATRMLQGLPEPAQEVLSRRHHGYFLSLAEEATEGPISADAPPAWLANLDTAAPDLRQALEWAVDGGHDQEAVDLAGALGWYWRVRKRYVEAIRWYESIPLDSEEITIRSRSRALRGAAVFATGFGTGDSRDNTKATEMAEESLLLARRTGDPKLIAASLNASTHIYFSTGDREKTVSVINEGLAFAEAAGDDWLQAHLRHYLALHHRDYGPVETAKSLFEENLIAFRKLGDDRMVGFALTFYGSIIAHEGDLELAIRLGRENLEIGRGTNDVSVLGNALEALGEITYLDGDFENARAYLDEAVDVRWNGRQQHNPDALVSLGFVAYAQGDLKAARETLCRTLELLRRSDDSDSWDAYLKRRGLWGMALVSAREERMWEAAVLFAAVDAATQVTPSRTFWIGKSIEYPEHLEMTAAVEAALSEDALHEAHHRGAAMTLDEATDYALNLLDDA